MSHNEVPARLRAFVVLGLDYHPDRVSHGVNGDNLRTSCPFCGKDDKFYISVQTGQWDCKAGDCGLHGNVYTFMQIWYKMQYDLRDDAPWEALSADRSLSEKSLKNSGMVYFDDEWYIPVYNPQGSMVNLRHWGLRRKQVHGLPDLDAALLGAERLAQADPDDPIFICEGEWDAIAMQDLMGREGVDCTILAVPGSKIWKEQWTSLIMGRTVVCLYDHDKAGRDGTTYLSQRILASVRELHVLQWPDDTPKGMDVRDLVSGSISWSEMSDLLVKVPVTGYVEKGAESAPVSGRTIPKRPSFNEVAKVFSQHLHLSEDMVVALKVIFAVVLSQQVQGDPLWVHIVSPPGTAKTQLLSPLSSCSNCHFASTLTAHSLVSGFSTQGGGDPSLLPRLNGKTLVLKDYTEILAMPAVQRDEIYSTLRGAYDGHVQKHYGNGLQRSYNVHFNMVSGVTHAVFGERGASLGERFLLFHLVKGVGFESRRAITAAIKNVGRESEVRADLEGVVQAFADVSVDPASLPDLPDEMLDRIVALSTLVSILRASVEKIYASGGQEKLLYRPQHEMGTRLGKQLTKLAYGLYLVDDTQGMGDWIYRIVVRVAKDTCSGFSLEVVQLLISKSAPQTIEQVCEALRLSHGTVRELLEDMCMLGSVVKSKKPNPSGRGPSLAVYTVTTLVQDLWQQSSLGEMIQ